MLAGYTCPEPTVLDAAPTQSYEWITAQRACKARRERQHTAGGCIEGDFQIKARQSNQHSSCRTVANFYRYLRGKISKNITTQRKQKSESADVDIVLLPLLKNSNRECEVVLAWMWQLGGWELLDGPGSSQHLTGPRTYKTPRYFLEGRIFEKIT